MLGGKGWIKAGATGGNNNNDNATVEWRQTNPNVGYGHPDDPVAELKYISANDTFVLYRKTQKKAGQSQEIMKIDKLGNVKFNTPVNFDRGYTSINTIKSSIDEKKIEIGMSESIIINDVTKNGNSTDFYTYIFSHGKVVSDKEIGYWRADTNNVFTNYSKNGTTYAISEHNLEINDKIIFTDFDTDHNTIGVNQNKKTVYFVKSLENNFSVKLSILQDGDVLNITKASSSDKYLTAHKYNGYIDTDTVFLQNAKTDSDTSWKPDNATNIEHCTCHISSVNFDEGNSYNFPTFTINKINNKVITSVDDNNNGIPKFIEFPILAKKLKNIPNSTGICILGLADNKLVSGGLTFDTESINITNSSGQTDTAIALNSDIGGITNTYHYEKNFTITDNSANTNSMVFTGSSTPDNTKIVINNSKGKGIGSGNAAIELVSDLGGICLRSGTNNSNAIRLEANSLSGGIKIESKGNIPDNEAIGIGTENFNGQINIGTKGNRTINIGNNVSDNKVIIEGLLTTRQGTIVGSDKRLKENISDIISPINKIKQIRPKNYSLKVDKKGTMKMGVIAQELKNILPDLVIGNEEKEFLSVDYNSFISLLIAGMQEQQKIIEKNEKFILDIKNQISIITNKI